jgi:hypothetical protein
MRKRYTRRETVWTPEEDDILLGNYLTCSNRELAAMIGTTVPFVKSRLLTLDLRRPKNLMEPTEGETWRTIDEAPAYSVSTLGRVKNDSTGILMAQVEWEGYLSVTLRLSPGPQKKFKVHRLVALAFLPAPSDPRGLTVNHKHGRKDLNVPEELEWMPHSDNVKHAWETGLNAHTTGEGHSNCRHPDVVVHSICHGLVEGRSGRRLAEDHGVTTAYVSGIRRRETRKDISKDYDW